jgi:hypothetical protein
MLQSRLQLLLVVPLLVPLFTAGIAPPSAPLIADAPDPAFKTKFQKLATQNARNDMAKLVKDETKDAIGWIVATGEEILTNPTPEAEAFMTDLRAAWTAGMKTEFAEKIYTIYSTFDAQNKKDHRDLHERFDKVWDEYQSNLSKKDNWVFLNLIDEIDILANGFDQMGDLYWSSEAWLVYAACNDTPLRGDAGDLKKALQGYTNALDLRIKLDLKDAGFDEAAKRKSALSSKAPDPKDPKKDSPGTPPPTSTPPKPISLGTPVTVPLEFEVVGSIDTYQRPNFHCDDFFSLWNALNFQKKGTSSGFPNTQGAPLAYRTSSTEISFDLDGDGQGEEKVTLSGNITPVKLAIGKGESQRPWAVLTMTGTDKDQYQGVEVNMSSTEDKLTVYFLGAASVTGNVAGVPIRVIDDTADGIYGTIPQTWGYPGMTAGVFQPDMDSIVIGAGKRAKPWSKTQQIGGAWYSLDLAPDGKQLIATPMTVDTGVLKLDYKGPAPTYLVVKGTTPQNDRYYDLVEGGAKGVTVPAGTYTLFYGELRKGKKRQMQKLAILPPATNAPQWTVGPGETVAVSLGGPYSFDFKATFEAEKLSIDGTTVAIIGAHGERYERAWNSVPKPEVVWRKKGTKKSSKPERMERVPDAAAVEKLGYIATWFPMKFEAELKGVEGPLEVQLTEKKHDIVGKIESPWRE